MQKLIDENLKITYENMAYEDACEQLKGNESKKLLLDFLNDSIVPVYRIRNWIDLAYEPLLPETGT